MTINIEMLRFEIQLNKLDNSQMVLSPLIVGELLDRLEATEKERDEFKRACFGHISDNSLLRAKVERMERRLRLILEEPENTMSNSKAMREMLRQARLALEESK